MSKATLSICLRIVGTLLILYGCFVFFAAIVNVARTETPTDSTSAVAKDLNKSVEDMKLFHLEFGMVRGVLTIFAGLISFWVCVALDTMERIERTISDLRRDMAAQSVP